MTHDKNTSSEKEIIIIRKAKKDDFIIIPNHLLEDSKLSWAAKGFMAYLIANEGKLEIFMPEDILKELIEYGYVSENEGAE